MFIQIDGKWYRVDGVGKKKIHLEEVKILVQYTENYEIHDREEVERKIKSHLLEMRKQEMDFQKFQRTGAVVRDIAKP